MKIKLCKLFGLCFCLLLTLALLPNTASADTVNYDLWVNNEQITSEHLTVTCGDGTAEYNPTENTLTLTNAKITEGCEQDWLYSGIVSYLNDVTIVLVGDNYITKTGGEGISTYHSVDGSFIHHDLTINGGGKLTINQDTEWYGYGVYCTGDLKLDNVTLNLNCAASGLWTELDMSITNCDITITSNMNGLVTNSGGMSADEYKSKSTISITNSVLDITALEGNSNGILVAGSETRGNLVVNSGAIKISAVSGILGLETEGIVSGSMTVNSGVINITATEKATNFTADNITLGDNVSVKSGAYDGTSCVIAPTASVLVAASYKGGKMLGVKLFGGAFPATVTETGLDVAAADTVKFFLIDGTQTFSPLCPAKGKSLG